MGKGDRRSFPLAEIASAARNTHGKRTTAISNHLPDLLGPSPGHLPAVRRHGQDFQSRAISRGVLWRGQAADGGGMNRRTSLLAWLGIPDWVAILIAIALLLLPAVKIQTVQPATIQIQLGGK